MKRRNVMMGGAAALGLGACSQSKFKTYNGPDITGIVVNKKAREMFLLNNGRVIEDYRIDLGFAPIGDKFFEGDGRTPEGLYLIDRRNPNSQFHLSLGISYPDRSDVAAARARGVDPGGDIFIHGTPTKWLGTPDWTWGCIAVTNEEMDEVYAMVNTGTLIYIYA